MNPNSVKKTTGSLPRIYYNNVLQAFSIKPFYSYDSMHSTAVRTHKMKYPGIREALEKYCFLNRSKEGWKPSASRFSKQHPYSITYNMIQYHPDITLQVYCNQVLQKVSIFLLSLHFCLLHLDLLVTCLNLNCFEPCGIHFHSSTQTSPSKTKLSDISFPPKQSPSTLSLLLTITCECNISLTAAFQISVIVLVNPS